MLAYTMTILYSAGIAYTVLFTLGYARRSQKHLVLEKVDYVSVIVPVYKEKTSLLLDCMESLARQSCRKKIKLYVVLTAAQPSQEALIIKFKSSFSSLTILRKKRPSLVKAYITALLRIKTEFTCIVNADILLEPDAIAKLYSFVSQKQLDIGFGLVMPKGTSKFSKFTSIKKHVRQLLLQTGRGTLGMGYYIPGAFYIARSALLKNNMQETFTDDVALMLGSYSGKKFRMILLPEVLAYELEKSSFYSWTIQFSRWFIGNVKIYRLWSSALIKSKMRVKFGIIGLLYIWYLLPISIVVGIFAVLLGLLNVWLLITFYALLTIILCSMKPIYKYGTFYIGAFWLVYSLSKVAGILISPYVLIMLKSNESKRYIIFKR
jgi:cellulose synthase/poly-beta-1,6-N-acetylglucosamine synthase-like glycosyltransferase